MQPTTDTLSILKSRALFFEKIRFFFRERGFLEVDTPLLAMSAHTDLYIEPLVTHIQFQTPQKYYLQTSPEFAMKQLLASGSGPIFQICKAFRDGDDGRYHRPEFTMLEWYRPHYDHNALMNEVEAFLQALLGTQKAQRFSYQQLFLDFLNVDPFDISHESLKSVAKKAGASEAVLASEKDALLHFLFTTFETALGETAPCFVYDFPPSQAGLSKMNVEKNVAERFEVFYKGIELGNGFHELCDPEEQRKRFEADNIAREKKNHPRIPLNENFLKSLADLPPCSGIAMGVDRMLMINVGASRISEVLPPF